MLCNAFTQSNTVCTFYIFWTIVHKNWLRNLICKMAYEKKFKLRQSQCSILYISARLLWKYFGFFGICLKDIVQMCKFLLQSVQGYWVKNLLFTVRRSYASAVLGVVILSVCLSVCPSVCHTRALWLSKEPTSDIFIPHERADLLVFWCERSRRNSNRVTPDWGTK